MHKMKKINSEKVLASLSEMKRRCDQLTEKEQEYRKAREKMCSSPSSESETWVSLFAEEMKCLTDFEKAKSDWVKLLASLYDPKG
jgi:hypothetical protein